jgi:pimeloyl-ACP methyl ester carboxylesterase
LIGCCRCCQTSVVPWIKPQWRESLASYASRLSGILKTADETVVCGVSFGGVVARELSLQLSAKACVLNSTIRSERELPGRLRLMRPLGVIGCEAALSAAGALAKVWPRRLRQPSTARLKRLAGRDGAWRRWATTALLQWSASSSLDRIPTTQIHAEQDQTFPLCNTQPEIVIRGGGHLIALTHATDIAVIVRQIAA